MPKIIIFIFTGIVLLVGGAIAAMQQMGMGPFSSEQTEASEEEKSEDLPAKKEIVLRYYYQRFSIQDELQSKGK